MGGCPCFSLHCVCLSFFTGSCHHRREPEPKASPSLEKSTRTVEVRLGQRDRVFLLRPIVFAKSGKGRPGIQCSLQFSSVSLAVPRLVRLAAFIIVAHNGDGRQERGEREENVDLLENIGFSRLYYIFLKLQHFLF